MKKKQVILPAGILLFLAAVLLTGFLCRDIRLRPEIREKYENKSPGGSGDMDELLMLLGS